MVEALLRVVRILVRGEEAELDDQVEFGELEKQQVELGEFDNKAELDMTTPPHLHKKHFPSGVVHNCVLPSHFVPLLRLRKPLRSKDGGVWASNKAAKLLKVENASNKDLTF